MSAVRLLSCGRRTGIHFAARVRTLRKSKPKNPNLAPRSKSTTFVLSSLTYTPSLKN